MCYNIGGKQEQSALQRAWEGGTPWAAVWVGRRRGNEHVEGRVRAG